MKRYNETGIPQTIWDRNRVDCTTVQPGDYVDDRDWQVPAEFTRQDLQPAGPREIWAVYNTFGDTAFLKASIESVAPYCDRVLVLYGGNWWNRQLVDDTEAVVRPLMRRFKIDLIGCSHFSGRRAEGQLAQRTHGLSLVPSGSWHWLVDSDEVYEAADAAELERFLRSPESDAQEAWAVEALAYYQRPDLIGWTEAFTRVFRSRQHRRFSGVMTVADGNRPLKSVRIPGIKLHHYSYVKPDAVIKEKLQDYERRHQAGEFRSVRAGACWDQWLELRQTGNLCDRAVHPIADYTGQLTRRVEQIAEIKSSAWWLGPEAAVSIIVVLHNSAVMTIEMLRSFRAEPLHGIDTVEWIFVDNASRPEDLEILRPVLDAEVPQHRWIQNEKNLMFTAGANQGLAAAQHRNLLLLNPDVRFHDGRWLGSMVEQLRRYPNGGVVGCRMVDGNGRIHHAGGIIEQGKFRHLGRDERDAGQYSVERDVEWVTGAVLLMSRECYCAVGGLDPQHRHLNSDNRFCLAARMLGFRVLYNASTVTHFCGRSCAA